MDKKEPATKTAMNLLIRIDEQQKAVDKARVFLEALTPHGQTFVSIGINGESVELIGMDPRNYQARVVPGRTELLAAVKKHAHERLIDERGKLDGLRRALAVVHKEIQS